MPPIFESDVEEFVIELLAGQGFDYLAPEQQWTIQPPLLSSIQNLLRRPAGSVRS
jgi:hypothetical protein